MRTKLTGVQVTKVLGLCISAANWSLIICSNSFRQWLGTGWTLYRIGFVSVISMRCLVMSVCWHYANPLDSVSIQTLFNSGSRPLSFPNCLVFRSLLKVRWGTLDRLFWRALSALACSRVIYITASAYRTFYFCGHFCWLLQNQLWF